MKKLLSVALFCAIVIPNLAQAQTIVVPDTLDGWLKTWTFNLNGTQASYNNWSEGGVNTIGVTGGTVYTNYYRKDRKTFGFRVNLRYGQTRIETNPNPLPGEDQYDTRKTDDLISIRTRGTYELSEGSKFSAYASVQLRTQFDDGFNYGAAISPAGGDSLISAFFAPAYLTEGVGIEYIANPSLKFEAGLGLKQTFISDGDLSPNYGLDRGDTFQAEGGLTTGITYQNTIAENLTYSSSLETFTNLLIPVSETDVFWSNEFVGQINSFLQASFTFELRYDNDFSREVQLKQVLSAGLNVNIF